MFVSKGTYRIAATCLALLVAFAVAGGMLAHAAIPHQHSHAGEGTDIGWQILHTSLRHEDKKSLLSVAADIFVLFCFGFITSNLARISLGVGRSRKRLSLDFDPLFEYLRSGTALYRRFG